MPSGQDNLIAIYAAFNRRDIDSVLALMHAEVDWPNGMEGGRMHGHAAVRSYWQRQWSIINPRVDPLGFTTDHLGRTVVDVHQVVRDLSGHVLSDRTIQHVYAFRDGLIARMDIVETGAKERPGRSRLQPL